jgi:hypothetical protein
MRSRRKALLLALSILAVLAAGYAVLRSAQRASAELPTAHPDEQGRLPDGIYATLAEADTFDAANQAAQPHIVLRDDGRFTGQSGPVTYVALATQTYVPLQLAAPPELTPGTNGFSSLQLQLDSQYTRGLERFSITHLRVALVIDGEIISRHKVRSAIRDGRIMVSRCADNVCEVLYTKLTD